MRFIGETARSGMIKNQPAKPNVTSKGRCTTSRKSSSEMVAPVPNMMTDKSVTIQLIEEHVPRMEATINKGPRR
ncbi:hypothetical protein [uncultured Agrobacterium sp.]|uniref:hypothetical protein n=2 Tax=uncultured Agrobacterium sp. TaxID=157277 RepID=UPI003439DC06